MNLRRSTSAEHYFDDMHLRLKGRQELLSRHAVFRQVGDLASLRVFMRSHVFAVWDFMSLTKSLQRALTCVRTPWVPNDNNLLARFINQIVLEEESDEVRPGVFRSHYELYLAAMREVGAETNLVEAFVNSVAEGHSPGAALEQHAVPESVAQFVRTTLELAEQSPHAVAAAFVMGREDVIPEMFRRLLQCRLERGPRQSEVRASVKTKVLSRRWWKDLTNPGRTRASGEGAGEPRPEGDLIRANGVTENLYIYLTHHIELDGDSHGPMARRLLVSLCGNDPQNWEEAERAATRAIDARLALWDGVSEELSSGTSVATERESSLRVVGIES